MRGSVSVVVPFLGDEAEARRVIAGLESLELRDGDELLIADNTPAQVCGTLAPARVRVVPAGEQRSASHARNRAAAKASGEWLLFLDADCVAPAGLLEAYFDPAPDARCAVVAGEITGDPSQPALTARWARARRGRWVARLLAGGLRPAGVTANMLVRRAAFEQAGGLRQGGGADFDLSWRLQDLGWLFEFRPRALVLHRDRERLRDVTRQARAYGSHVRTLRERYGPVLARPVLARPLVRSLAAAAGWLLRADAERAAFGLIDGLHHAHFWLGWRTAQPGPHRGD